MKRWCFILIVITSFLFSKDCYSWGSEGHRIVADIAFHYLDPATRDSVKKYLGETSIHDAATWMDDMRNDPSYNYMKPWHYINLEKGEIYSPTTTFNIVNELTKVIFTLQNEKQSKEQTNTNLKFLFHLLGDLHQPLHDGYGSDKGGNSIAVTFLGKESNLHKVWDSEIIREKKITTEGCLKIAGKYPKRQIKKLQKTDVVKWMNESRSLLGKTYDFSNNIIDAKYIETNATVIEKQLIIAGIRLAGILNALYRK
jgi:hypothetical protein